MHDSHLCYVGFKDNERVKGLLKCYTYRKLSSFQFLHNASFKPYKTHIKFRDTKYLKGFVRLAIRLFGPGCIFHIAPMGKYLPLLIEKKGLFVCIGPSVPDKINEIMFTKQCFKYYSGCKCPAIINRKRDLEKCQNT